MIVGIWSNRNKQLQYNIPMKYSNANSSDNEEPTLHVLVELQACLKSVYFSPAGKYLITNLLYAHLSQIEADCNAW